MRTALFYAAVFSTVVIGACSTRTPAPVTDRTPPSAQPAPAAPPEPVPAPPVAEVVPPPPSPPPPAPDWRPQFYTVKRGDTLFQIALEHGLDYRELAALNNIENINRLRIGQVLRVRPPAPVTPDATVASGPGPATAPLVTVPPVTDARPVAPVRVDRPSSDTYKTAPKATRLPYSEAALAQLQAQSGSGSAPVVVPGTPVSTSAPAPGPQTPSATGSTPSAIPPLASAAPAPGGIPPTPAPPPSAAASADGEDQVDWAWPVKGKILSGFSESASLKGIDIAGTKGVPVLATAAGRVVYAGSGLRGYGKLVIVKHNKTYLSAYAHLDEISIREGQNVTKGQAIGKMGATDADQVKLHFEIRSLGKPVDPMRYLPKG